MFSVGKGVVGKGVIGDGDSRGTPAVGARVLFVPRRRVGSSSPTSTTKDSSAAGSKHFPALVVRASALSALGRTPSKRRNGESALDDLELSAEAVASRAMRERRATFIEERKASR